MYTHTNTLTHSQLTTFLSIGNVFFVYFFFCFFLKNSFVCKANLTKVSTQRKKKYNNNINNKLGFSVLQSQNTSGIYAVLPTESNVGVGSIAADGDDCWWMCQWATMLVVRCPPIAATLNCASMAYDCGMPAPTNVAIANNCDRSICIRFDIYMYRERENQL